jgi:type III restriction enzyme
LVQDDEGERVYFVVETKSTLYGGNLRPSEAGKIACGKEHFKALAEGESSARFAVARKLDELLATLEG